MFLAKSFRSCAESTILTAVLATIYIWSNQYLKLFRGQDTRRSKIEEILSRVHWAWFAAGGAVFSAVLFWAVGAANMPYFLADACAIVVGAALVGYSFRLKNRRVGRPLTLGAAALLACKACMVLFRNEFLGILVGTEPANAPPSIIVMAFLFQTIGLLLLFMAIRGYDA